MVNTNVFSGADAIISLSIEQGVEGEEARQVIDTYQLTQVGRATSIEVRVSSELKPFHDIGQQYPTGIKSGNVTISGTIGRAYINGALLKLLLGEAATSRPASTWVQPSFDIVLRLANAALPGVSSTVVLHGVKFQNWSLVIPEDDFIMEKAEFLALWISVEDE
jgi:hypothetical protein